MVYVEPFDPTTPSDLADLGEGDDRIRELKRALIERLQTIIPGFPDTDPLVIPAESTTPVSEGTLVARPNPPSAEGLFYFAGDTDQLFMSVLAVPPEDPPVWMELFIGSPETEPPAGIGLLSVRPNPPVAEGLLFYATDERKMYISQETAVPDVFEWITDASTLGRTSQITAGYSVVTGSPLSPSLTFLLDSVNTFVLAYRVRGVNQGVGDWSSWIHTEGQAMTVIGSGAGNNVNLSIFSAISVTAEPWRFLFNIALNTTSATPQIIDVEAEIVTSEV